MTTSIVIGNMVRGFEVISGFTSEDAANNWVAENRKRVGSEHRLAPETNFAQALAPSKEAIVQDSLDFGKEKPGEMIDPSTGLSVDIQPKPEEADKYASKQADRSNKGQAEHSGTFGGGVGPTIPGVHKSGGTVSGAGTVSADDRGGIAGGAGTSDKGDMTK